MTDWIYVENSVWFRFVTICSANYWFGSIEEAELFMKLVGIAVKQFDQIALIFDIRPHQTSTLFDLNLSGVWCDQIYLQIFHVWLIIKAASRVSNCLKNQLVPTSKHIMTVHQRPLLYPAYTNRSGCDIMIHSNLDLVI